MRPEITTIVLPILAIVHVATPGGPMVTVHVFYEE